MSYDYSFWKNTGSGNACNLDRLPPRVKFSHAYADSVLPNS